MKCKLQSTFVANDNDQDQTPLIQGRNSRYMSENQTAISTNKDFTGGK